MVVFDTLEKKSMGISELPQGKKPVECMWIFTVKHKADGSTNKFKAWHVAKGLNQSYGNDYNKTFALKAKLNSIQVFVILGGKFRLATLLTRHHKCFPKWQLR